MSLPLGHPGRRDAGAFEVSLPCPYCGDEVAMSWPNSAASPSQARRVVRCRTCQEVAYFVVRGEDGTCRVHPCGPGLPTPWPDDADRPRRPGHGVGFDVDSYVNRDSSPARRVGFAAPTPSRGRARPASAPRIRGNADIARDARRRGASAERWASNEPGELWEADNWRDAYGRPPARPREASSLLQAFAATVFGRFPDEASAFDAFDANGNGVIGRAEFLAGADFIHFQGDAGSVFRELDMQRRGYLGRREFAALSRWVPQASMMRPSKARQAVVQGKRAYHQTMPPAGMAVEFANREWGECRAPIGSLANNRHSRAQKGQGVAAALDSWGTWRNWQEPEIDRQFYGPDDNALLYGPDEHAYDNFQYDSPDHARVAWEAAARNRLR